LKDDAIIHMKLQKKMSQLADVAVHG